MYSSQTNLIIFVTTILLRGVNCPRRPTLSSIDEIETVGGAWLPKPDNPKAYIWILTVDPLTPLVHAQKPVLCARV